MDLRNDNRMAGVRRKLTKFDPSDVELGETPTLFTERFEAAFQRYGGAQRYGTCSRQSFGRHALSLSEMSMAVINIDVSVWMSLLLSCALTWVCIEFEVYWNIQLALLISPIVFPLAFSINESYRRREKVLDDMAGFMGAAAELYWLHRDWAPCAGLEPEHAVDVRKDVTDLLINLIHYCATEIPDRLRAQRLGAVYRIFSRLAKKNDLMRKSSLPGNPPLCTRLIHYHNCMCESFERLRVVREYRTPRGIRGYTKMIVFFLPIILAPYFAFLARKGAMDVTEFGQRNPSCQNGNAFCDGQYKPTDFTSQTWSAYFSAAICALVFGSLQAVQDTLDDPFDGIGQDDIDLHLITSWAPSALWDDPADQRIPVLVPTDDTGRGSWCPHCLPALYTVSEDEPQHSEDIEVPGACEKTLPPAAQKSGSILVDTASRKSFSVASTSSPRAARRASRPPASVLAVPTRPGPTLASVPAYAGSDGGRDGAAASGGGSGAAPAAAAAAAAAAGTTSSPLARGLAAAASSSDDGGAAAAGARAANYHTAVGVGGDSAAASASAAPEKASSGDGADGSGGKGGDDDAAARRGSSLFNESVV